MIDFYDDDYENNDHPEYEEYYFSDQLPSEDAEECQFCVLPADDVYDGMYLCMHHYNLYTSAIDEILEEVEERKRKTTKKYSSYFS